MTNSHPQGRYQRLPSQQSIRVFEAAARHLSFTQAGIELAMTQSGVSKQIKGLESFLGVSLFIREGHQIVLTEAGRMFHSRCCQALDNLQLAVNEVQGSQSRIRLQAPPTFASRWLIPRMALLKQAHPELELHIETTWLRTVSDRVKVEGNELAIHACRDYPHDDLQQQLLRRELLCVLVSPLFTDRYGQINNPTDLIGKPLIHTRIDGHIHWQAWVDAIDFPQLDISQGYEFETLDMALSAAENGIGIVVCDLIYALDALENGTLKIPFIMPILSGLQYLLLSPLNHRPTRPQENYQQWLEQQINKDNQRLQTILKTLGLSTSPLLEAFK